MRSGTAIIVVESEGKYTYNYSKGDKPCDRESHGESYIELNGLYSKTYHSGFGTLYCRRHLLFPMLSIF
jgi:hypothetical protein